MKGCRGTCTRNACPLVQASFTQLLYRKTEKLASHRNIRIEFDIDSCDDWWRLYLRLVEWELKFDKHEDSGLHNILFEQIQSCNKAFSNFIAMNYEDLTKKDNESILSPSVFRNHALPKIKEGQKSV